MSAEVWQTTLYGSRTTLEPIEDWVEHHVFEVVSTSLFVENKQWKLEIASQSKPSETWLVELQTVCGGEVECTLLPAKNWVLESQRFLRPIQAGRFVIYAGKTPPELASQSIGICIPAGMAFGTGHHGTTSGCLRVFDQILCEDTQPNSILDLGTGAGILAIAAAKSCGGSIVATDIDPIAVEVANRNAAANLVTDRIRFWVADGVDHQLKAMDPFELVFANILAAPLIEMAKDISSLLAPKGQLILAGLLNEQTDEVCMAFQGHGLKMVSSLEMGDWTILRMQP